MQQDGVVKGVDDHELIWMSPLEALVHVQIGIFGVSNEGNVPVFPRSCDDPALDEVPLVVGAFALSN
jgi:hypothetical protein